MELFKSLVSSLGAGMVGGAAGAALDFALEKLGTGAGKHALDRIKRQLDAYTGRIPPNHDLEQAIHLAHLSAASAVLTQFAAEIRRHDGHEVAFQDHPFFVTVGDWIDAQLKILPGHDGAATPPLVDQLERQLDPILSARSPADLCAALAPATAELWAALAATGTPPGDLEAHFRGPEGWPIAFLAFMREALKDKPRAELAFVAARLGGIRPQLDRIAGKIDRVIDTQAEHTAKLDELLAIVRASGRFETAAEQGISEAAVRAIVERLGGIGLSRDDLIPWLDGWITRASEHLARGSNEGAAFDAATRESDALFNAGQLDEAAEPFMRELAREEAREAAHQAERRRHRVALLEAAIDADTRALNIAAIPARLRLLAAERGIVPGAGLAEWLHAYAEERYDHGRDMGDNAALLVAIAVWRATLEERPHERVPLDWAMTQNNLGVSLATLGARESGPARLEDAVEAYRAALMERTRARVPLDWAMTQNNLGAALQTLAERESGTARLEEAVEAFRAALTEYTRARVPLQWATTQNNLGNALARLGEREGGTARLDEAVEAYRAALTEYTQARVPLDWAMTQNNLGTALRALGERERGTARLEEAVEAYRAALTEYTRARVPLDWAMTQSNLGNALGALGERERGTARLAEAVEAYRAALTEYTRARVPLDWAMTQNNLGNALRALGARESGTARLEEAVEAFRAALTELTRARVPLQWAMTQNNLGNALRALGEREGGTARLAEAVEAYRAALTERTRARVPLQWAITTHNLALALAAIAGRAPGLGRLEEAIALWGDCLAVAASAGHAPLLAAAERGRAEAVAERGRRAAP